MVRKCRKYTRSCLGVPFAPSSPSSLFFFLFSRQTSQSTHEIAESTCAPVFPILFIFSLSFPPSRSLFIRKLHLAHFLFASFLPWYTLRSSDLIPATTNLFFIFSSPRFLLAHFVTGVVFFYFRDLTSSRVETFVCCGYFSSLVL